MLCNGKNLVKLPPVRISKKEKYLLIFSALEEEIWVRARKLQMYWLLLAAFDKIPAILRLVQKRTYWWEEMNDCCFKPLSFGWFITQRYRGIGWQICDLKSTLVLIQYNDGLLSSYEDWQISMLDVMKNTRVI